jgi:hypothetical protein
MNNLRNLLNDSYTNIDPIFFPSVRNAINAAETNEEDLSIQLENLITCLANNTVSDENSISHYLSSINRNSVTRRFFEPFVRYQFDRFEADALIIVAQQVVPIIQPIPPIHNHNVREAPGVHEDIDHFYEE